jgi:phage-related protein
MAAEFVRPLRWIAGSKKDYLEFPPQVQHDLGFALYRVQTGAWWSDARALSKGLLRGLGIWELRENDEAGTYRVVYLARFAEVVYVLHAFQKKSTHGIATPQREIELIRARYDAAIQEYGEQYSPYRNTGRETKDDR